LIATLLSSRVYPNSAIKVDIDVGGAAPNPDNHLVSEGCVGLLREPDQISIPGDPVGDREVNVIVNKPTKLP
jgi:hypothetical protein